MNPFVLATQVINIEEWTPAVVEKRQKELVGKMVEKWGLKGGG